MGPKLCAVDVGTRSARAAIVSPDGALLGRAESPFALYEPERGHLEQDSEEIWRAVCLSVHGALARSGVAAGDIVGIAFDATCSVVVRDGDGRPLPVSASAAGPVRDTMVWMDHRAMEEARLCTATAHPVVTIAGGAMSPEMAIPKLMWLKRHRPDSWSAAGLVFDLADFLVWRASGSTQRSRCTLACKWAYVAGAGGWQPDFLAAIGLPDLSERGGLPAAAVAPGAPLGTLLPVAAEQLGLSAACRVAAGLVDAYAGALGVLAPEILAGRDPKRNLALIAGTSGCVMTLTPDPLALPGFWGPYSDVILPGNWTTEGGQSAAGALLDHVVRLHGAGGEPTPERHRAIIERIGMLRAQHGDSFGRGLHVLPDFHGNRSPLGQPDALGVVSGLALDASFDGLCALYWRCCVAIALGIRHILDAYAAEHGPAETLYVTGGHTRNRLLIQLYADATGCRIAEIAGDEGVLVGTAMLAATGAGLYPGLAEACVAMRQATHFTLPDGANRSRLDADYSVFRRMQRHRAEIAVLDAGRG